MGVGVGTVAYNQVKLGTATVWTFNVLLLVFLLFSDEFKKKKVKLKTSCALSCACCWPCSSSRAALIGLRRRNGASHFRPRGGEKGVRQTHAPDSWGYVVTYA